MKVLVVGNGGREHAIVWKLCQSPSVTKIWCTLANPGICAERLSKGGFVEYLHISAQYPQDIVDLVKECLPDLVVIGPDRPLAAGLTDMLVRVGAAVWGPNSQASRFEWSKAYAQEFMERHGIPHAKGGVFLAEASALEYAKELGFQCVVKADGLCAGKGAHVCRDDSEVKAAIVTLKDQHAFVDGGKIVLQELLDGPELSIHALCDGKKFLAFPPSRDHKRLLTGDKGPNTGGMGAFAPVSLADPSAMERIETEILAPWLAGCVEEGIDYRGLVYPGIILTDEGPKVIEWNARFGDPEAQAYLPLLENDLFDLMCKTAYRPFSGLGTTALSWKQGSVVGVVMATADYCKKDTSLFDRSRVPLKGLRDVESLPGIKVFHSGTITTPQGTVTTGGRALCVTAHAPTLAMACMNAYEAAKLIKFDGAHMRRDIGYSGLVPEPVS
jgi:phosphoribosylamine--glycine ligase